MLAVAPIQTAVQLDSVQFCILFKIMTLHLLFSISHDHGFIFHSMKILQKNVGLSVTNIFFPHLPDTWIGSQIYVWQQQHILSLYLCHK